MSMAFVPFGWIVLLTTPSAVELSVCRRVGGCLCPILLRICLIGIASRELIYKPPSSASVLVVRTTICTAPLLQGSSSSGNMKKWHHALLHAFDSERYDASMWITNTVSLALYLIMASGYVDA